MNYTDTKLKQALAKMLPEKLYMMNNEVWGECLAWNGNYPKPVLDTELLHLCWMVEETLTMGELAMMNTHLNIGNVMDASSAPQHKSWQQRVTALAKVKGITI